MKPAQHQALEQALEQVEGALDVAVREQALELAGQVRRHDGVEAISEASRLALTAGEAAVTHILAWRDGRLAGYCQRDREGASAELAVAPPARRLGLAKAMIRTLAVDTPGVRLWAHGDLPAARRVADSLSLTAVRELWEMTSDRRTTTPKSALPAADAVAAAPAPAPPGAPAAAGGPAASCASAAGPQPAPADAVAATPAPAPPGARASAGALAASCASAAADAVGAAQAPAPPGAPAAAGGPAASFTFRQFDPRTDRAAWVELNAAAFADHPEQGKLTVADLDRRMAEGWFEAAGLVFAQDGEGGRPAGYVWTKVVGHLGEIYAIGVRPESQGRRLGTKLLEIGLDHMERRGITEIRLFVEAGNAPAVAAYRRQGFRVTRRDIQYAFQ